MITTVLFDKDGTLFDFRATWGGFAAKLIEDLSSGEPEKARVLASAVGFDLSTTAFLESSVLVAGTPGDIANCLLPHLPGTTPSALVSRMNRLAANVPQAEVTELLPFLSRLCSDGMTIGVITNDALAPTKAHLKAAGVVQLFAHIVASDCGYGSKPAPGQINAFLEMTGGRPEKTVMVGDAPSDLMAARAAGCFAVGVLSGHYSRGQLSPLADCVIQDISELPELLLNWPKQQTDAA